MDLDEATVYTTETKHNSSLTPLYAILQAKDHEADRHHSDQLIDQGKKHTYLCYSVVFAKMLNYQLVWIPCNTVRSLQYIYNVHFRIMVTPQGSR